MMYFTWDNIGLISIRTERAAVSRKSILWITGALLVPLIAVGAFLYSAIANEEEHRAIIHRVIDGDTIDVLLDQETVRVRLLNIDTPETKHPNEVIGCLGPEANDFLTDLLPVGTEVVLEYDEQREDPYGRLLAGVFHQGELVNAQIAAEGLGTAVVYEPNRKFYEPVKAAEELAREQEQGLFDPQVECTLPHQLADLQQQVEAVEDELPDDVEAIDETLEDVAALSAIVSEYSLMLSTETEDSAVLLRLYGAEIKNSQQQLERDNEALQQKKDELEDHQEKLELEEERRKEEEERKRKEAEEERERQEAEAQAEAEAERQREAEAAAAAEAERQRQAEAESPRNAQPETPTPSRQGDGSGASTPTTPRGSTSTPQPAPQQRNQAPSGYGTDSDYPGYTGPRCYAPGGKFWRPC